MRKILLSSQAIEDMVYFATGQIKLLGKIARLLESINAAPFTGIGKPELLKNEFQGYWSRRIDQEHRVIYRVTEQYIEILSLKGHYEG